MSEMNYGESNATAIVNPVGAVSTTVPAKSLNAELASFDVRISRITRASMQQVPNVRNITDAKWGEVERWLIDGVGKAIAGRKSRNNDKRIKWRKCLAGERSVPRMRRDQANMSVPLTVWASAAVRARMRAGTVESDPLIVVTPNASVDLSGDIASAARKLVTFYTALYRNPRDLGGLAASDKIIAEVVPLGTAAKKVHIEPDRVRWVWDAVTGGLTRVTQLGRVRHEYIAADDAIYPLGYGTDVQAMPFIGHQFPWTWQDLLEMREAGYLDADAVASVGGQGTTANEIGGSVHIAYETHNCAEVYFDYPLFDDGLPVALCSYLHIDREVLLGVRYSYSPKGIKPVWLYNFDINPDPTSPEGQGVCEKLDGVQEETDLIHNLGIESAKRAIAHVIVLKEGSGADDDFGGDVPLLPGDHVTTERPEEDFRAVPLGSPEGMQAAIAQEANSLRYVMRLLGLDESALGNVESGKRVPASLGLEIKKDSRVITSHAIANFGAVETEVTYYSLELLRLRLPEDTLVAACGPDGAALLKQTVFSTSDFDLRSRYVINFNATDAAATEESRKQQLLVVGQYLQSFYDRVIQYAQLAMQLPPPLQKALMDILQKMENGTRALLNTIDDIHNPDDLLPKIADLAAAVEQAGSSMTQQPGGARQP